MQRTTIGMTLASLAILSGTTYGQPAENAPPAEQPQQQPQPQQQQSAKQPDTLWASRSLRVASRQPTGEFLDAILRGAAAEHAGILGVSATTAFDVLKVREPSGGGGGGLFGDRRSGDVLELTIDLRSVQQAKPNPRAAEFLDNVITSLGRRLGEWHAERSGFTAAQRDARRAGKLLAEVRAQFRELEQTIRRATGRADASVDAIRASVPKLDEERQSLKLQVVGKEARQAALAAAIERLAKAAAERADGDPVAAELQKVVEVRERAVQLVHQEHQGAMVGAREVSETEAALAEARARMLERRDSAMRANGGELLETLNRELATLSIDAAESQAKLAALDALLAKYVEAEDLLTRAEDVRRERDQLERDLQQAEARQAQARASLPEPVLRVFETDEMKPDDPRLKDDAGATGGDGDSRPQQ